MCKSGYYALSVTIRREEKACGGLGTVLLGDAKDADRNPIVHSCPHTAAGFENPPVVARRKSRVLRPLFAGSPFHARLAPAVEHAWAFTGKACGSDLAVQDEILKCNQRGFGGC